MARLVCDSFLVYISGTGGCWTFDGLGYNVRCTCGAG
jgi:hypothetical protein